MNETVTGTRSSLTWFQRTAPDDADTDEKQKKLIRFVEKIASNQYFQKASQMNFVKKALEGVSNMSIMLTVQINSLNGTLGTVFVH